MENFCNDLWPLIYDQANHGRHEKELAFYAGELLGEEGPVLDVACGTGMILLPLLEKGVDIYGFDVSETMLAVLYRKTRERGIRDVEKRVTCQNMVDFRYGQLFRAIAIPARSFLHLVTQVEQIVCLRNIHAHLAEGGRLLLNFFTPRLDALLKFTDPTPNYVQLNVFKHPVTGEDLEVSYRQVNDLNEQVQDIRWRFCSGGRVQETPMKIRWIYRNEFLLLAKLAGFDQTAVYGDFDKSAYKGEGEMVWVVEK